MRSERKPSRRQSRSLDELTQLVEDALSAAAGWTVPPPKIYPVESKLGAPNWTVDVRQLDDRMLDAVRSLRDRYELKTQNARLSTWGFIWRFVRVWRSRRHLCI